MNSNRYSAISTVNHWVTAVLVVVMLALGLSAGAAPSDEIEDYVLGVHVALGFFVLIVVIWRIGFRLYEGFPPAVQKNAALHWLASFTHRAMLLLLLLQVFTGPMYLFTENECINVFGWFSLCVPLESLASIHDLMEWLHVTTGTYLLPGLFLLHFIGAIHHFAARGATQTPADL